MPQLQLQAQDSRLIYLATVYHLGRPGSETDPDTLQRHDMGLSPVQRALEPQLDQAVAQLEVSPYQLTRLDEGLHGVVNELKQYEMSSGRSAVPGFGEAIVRLYPDIAGPEGESGGAMDLVGHAVMLQRRLHSAVEQARADVEAARGAQVEAARATRLEGRWRNVWRRWLRRS